MLFDFQTDKERDVSPEDLRVQDFSSLKWKVRAICRDWTSEAIDLVKA